jgi:hypothetical protein
MSQSRHPSRLDSAIAGALCALALATANHAAADDWSSTNSNPALKGHTMNIAIKFADKTVIAKLDDNPTSRDLMAQLPLKLSFEDYHATEKIAYLPRKLSVTNAPDGFDPSVGTIAYYAPWGNIAVFYRDFGYSKSLINLGTVVSGVDALRQTSAFEATIERASE